MHSAFMTYPKVSLHTVTTYTSWLKPIPNVSTLTTELLTSTFAKSLKTCPKDAHTLLSQTAEQLTWL